MVDGLDELLCACLGGVGGGVDEFVSFYWMNRWVCRWVDASTCLNSL